MAKNDNHENLQINIPAELKQRLAVDAASQRTTIRAIILRALTSAGYPISEDELRDKRKA